MPRNPLTISAEARDVLDTSNKAFVPTPIVKLAELSVEFMESTAATLDAAGLVKPEQPAAPAA